MSLDILSSTATVDFAFDTELLEDILLEHVVRAFGDDTYSRSQTVTFFCDPASERWEAASAMTVAKVTEHDTLFELLIQQMGAASKASLIEVCLWRHLPGAPSIHALQDMSTVSTLMATSQRAVSVESEVNALSSAEEIATESFNTKSAKLQPIAARGASFHSVSFSSPGLRCSILVPTISS